MVGLGTLATIAFGWYAASVTVERREVIGIIATLDKGGYMSRRYAMFVRLDDGRTVRVGAPGHITMKIGQRVRVLEARSRLMSEYSFAGFVEEQPETVVRGESSP